MDDKPIRPIDRVIDFAIWVAFLGVCLIFVWAVVHHWGGWGRGAVVAAIAGRRAQAPGR